MHIELVLSILSIVIILVVPLIFYLINRKRNIKGSFFDFLVGIIFLFLVKDVLLKLIINLIANIPFVYKMLFDKVASVFITTIILSLLYFLGLIIIKKVYFKNNITINNIVFFVMGIIFSEIILNFLMPAISNIIYLVQIDNGTLYDNLIKTISHEQATAIINTYGNFNASYYIYFGSAFLYTFASTYLIVTMFSRSNSIKQMIVVFAMLFILNLLYYLTNPLISSISIIVLIFTSIVLLSFAELNFKALRLNG